MYKCAGPAVFIIYTSDFEKHELQRALQMFQQARPLQYIVNSNVLPIATLLHVMYAAT